jgi:hypothetical protein
VLPARGFVAMAAPPPSAAPAPLFENFLLYETRARYYLVAYTSDKAAWRVLKISRMEAQELEVRAARTHARCCTRPAALRGRECERRAQEERSVGSC